MKLRPAKFYGLLLGPILFLTMALFIHPHGMSQEARMVLASTLWIATWWITEAIPIPMTSLLPLILFPLSNAMTVQEAGRSYGDPIIFLYLGGFIIAVAIEKWGLHRRIALNTILRTGTDARLIILGFMLATGFVSMWISNTATAVMMLPIGTAIISQLSNEQGPKDFGKALMLSIAYAASIGGMATLIGTPTNLVFAGIVRETYQTEISFTQWMAVGLPVSILLLFLSWLYLTRVGFQLKGSSISGGRDEIKKMLNALGKISFEEKAVGIVFAFTALCWMLRSFVLTKWLPGIDDSMIALAGAMALFLIPSRNEKGTKLIDWKAAVNIPWGIILLFGGGLTIASAFQSSGLAAWLGNQMTLLQGIPLLLLIFILVSVVTLLSEIASNVATAAMILPILVALAVAIGVQPYLLMVTATLAASCGFMLPVATPPNAVVFGSGYLSIRDMIKAGFWMDILCVVIVSLFVFFFMDLLWSGLI
jgi:sodium-dependent dicarboxylate transporter 2/3/5